MTTEDPLDTIVIRPATPADAEAGAICHVESWREAYAGIIADDVLARATRLDRRIAAWQELLAIGWTTILAVLGDEVIGFAGVGPGRDPDQELTVELEAIYVRRAWWGTGLSHRLITAAIGDQDAYVWVLRDNLRARAFYAKHGFVADGAGRFLDQLGVSEIRMVRSAP